MAVESGGRQRRGESTAAVPPRPTGDAPTGRLPPPFVGRETELDAVLQSLAEPPSLVLVEGEAGIGKTRLLHEALRSESLAGATVLVAACPPLAEPFPLGSVVAALRRLADRLGSVQLTPLGGALRPLFPEWADLLPPPLEPLDDPRETRHRILRALTELVERLGVDLLVVEDAHWADAATLEWLLMLVTTEPASGLARLSGGSPAPPPARSLAPRSIVVTYRPTDVPAGSLLPRLSSRPPAGLSQLRVELDLLDLEQTRRLVGSRLGAAEVSAEFAAFLHERTDGLPLAVEETIRLMRERHDIIRRSGEWSRRILDELDVPPTVRASVLERVDRLPAPARRVLEAAAVLGEPADHPTLVAVAGLTAPAGPAQAGQAGVGSAMASGLLQEADPGRYGFRHVLDAQAVADAIPVPERRTLHRRAAEALRHHNPLPMVRLARHFREAGDTEAWAHYAEASGDLALASGDDRTAVGILLDLLGTLEHPMDRRIHLARKLGAAAALGTATVPETAQQVVTTLRSVLEGDHMAAPEAGEIRLLLVRLLYQLGDDPGGYAESEIAVAELADRPARAAQAMVMLGKPDPQRRPTVTSRAWLERAATLFDAIESPLERLIFMVDHASHLLHLGMAEGRQAFEAIPQTAPTAAERWQILRGQVNLLGSEITWGRYTDARRRLAALPELVRSDGFLRAEPFLASYRVRLDWFTGRWDGLAAAAAQLAAAEDAPPQVRQDAHTVHSLLDFVAGNRERGERCLRELLDHRRQIDWPGSPDGVLAALAHRCLADGAVADALELTAAPMELVVRLNAWWQATDLVAGHIDVLARAGRLDEAEAVVGQLARWLQDRDHPALGAALATCRAIVTEGRGDQRGAVVRFGQAADAWAALPRPYDELLVLERRGRCLVAAGDHEQGRQVLSDAQQRLHDLGARWDADRIAHLLREHGVEVPRVWRRGPKGYGDRLSPRELEVVELVARGMTNKQVAQALFLSPKTVGQHLSTSMRKLGVSSRTAVAIAAAETGLLSSDRAVADGP